MLDAFIIDQIRRREEDRDRRQRPLADRPGGDEHPDERAPRPADGFEAPRHSATDEAPGRRGVWTTDDDEDGAGYVIDM